MKKLFLSLSVAVALVACKPAQEQKKEAFQMPAVEDIAMYQVNPRGPFVECRCRAPRLYPGVGRQCDVGNAHLSHRY